MTRSPPWKMLPAVTVIIFFWVDNGNWIWIFAGWAEYFYDENWKEEDKAMVCISCWDCKFVSSSLVQPIIGLSSYSLRAQSLKKIQTGFPTIHLLLLTKHQRPIVSARFGTNVSLASFKKRLHFLHFSQRTSTYCQVKSRSFKMKIELYLPLTFSRIIL